MWGLPTAVNQSKAMRGELWAGVTLNGWRPGIKTQMKGALRPMKPEPRISTCYELIRRAESILYGKQCGEA